jgi:hypothetical protein
MMEGYKMTVFGQQIHHYQYAVERAGQWEALNEIQ